MNVRPQDLRLDSNGLVKTTHGVSLSTNAAKLERFGGARRIKALPEGLKIIQRGADPSHYEIVPTFPMTLEQFQNLLNLIVFFQGWTT
jgi:hypothetical protein